MFRYLLEEAVAKEQELALGLSVNGENLSIGKVVAQEYAGSLRENTPGLRGRVCPPARRLPGPAGGRPHDIGGARLQAARTGEHPPDAEAEIAALAAQEELERARDALIEFYAGAVPEALDQLDGEERNSVYRMLRLEITPRPDGILSDNLQIHHEPFSRPVARRI